MRRPRSRRPVNGIQLFPFLAVLICAMGAIIVLLVMVVRQARIDADTILAARPAETPSSEPSAAEVKQAQELEDLEWERQILEQQHQALGEKLAGQRLELSHLEDHIRRLEKRWQELVAEAQAMERLGQKDSQTAVATHAEVNRLRAAADAERKRLEAARQEAAARKRSFAIIPYPGPNGTRRRPIYVECRETGIVIQPEGIVLRPDDLAGPLGPGNPLDAALRAIREHWARVGGNEGGEPYPLLIVRPDGAVAYSMARAAIAAWDGEFGYELVEDPLELRYPPSDAALKPLLENALAVARQRQSLLAAAMPARFGRESPERFAMPDNYAKMVAATAADSEPGGRGFAAGGHSSGGGGLPSGLGGAVRSPAGSATGGPLVPGGPSTTPGNSLRPGAAASPGTAGSADASPPGGPHDRREANGAGTTNAPAGASSPSGSGPLREPPGATAGGAPSAAGGPNAGGASRDASGQNAGGGLAGGLPLRSLAAHKGANWALRDVKVNTVGITRPIAVECYHDRLVLLPDRLGHAPPHVTPMGESTRDAIEPFVAGVWARIDRWGLAVANGYWKPVLRVRVYPGGETRYHELEVLLKDSGLVLERRE